MPPGWWRHSRRNVRRTRRFRVGKVIIGRLFSPEDLVDQDAGQPVLSEAGVEAGRVVLGREPRPEVDACLRLGRQIRIEEIVYHPSLRLPYVDISPVPLRPCLTRKSVV